MAMQKLILRPGVDVQRSRSLNEGGISTSNLIRFFEGLPQKLGGWQQLSGVSPFIGTCRGLYGWADLSGNAYIAVGTEQRLQLVASGTLNDITPYRKTSNIAPAFATTNGSALVDITDASNGAAVGDWIYLATHVSIGGVVLYGYYQIPALVSSSEYEVTAASAATATASGGAVPVFATTNGSSSVEVTLDNHGFVVNSLFPVNVSTSVGGVTISGTYPVATIVDANHFTITASALATSTASASENGGNAQINYLLATGSAVDLYPAGYGEGAYGSGAYGEGSGSGFTALRQWSLDHFGQDLIANPSGGGLYYWAPPNIAPAVVLSVTAPTECLAMCVMSQAQIILACGAESSGTLYPTLVRWCDEADFTDWTPTVSNQAGSYQIPTGSKIIACLSIGLGALIWTDVDIWAVTYQGPPFVFDFNRLAVAAEAISLRCVVVVPGDLVIWPSYRTFFIYDGASLQPLPCPVWDFFYENMDFTQPEQTFAALNSLFNEVAWHFPISPSSSIYNASAPMGYIKWNYVEKSWDYGQSSQYQRTAWIDHSPYGNPIGADPSGLLQMHEVGYDANGVAMQWSWGTGFFDIQDGEEFGFVDFLIPDFLGNYTAISATVYATDSPNESYRAYGPYSITPSTNYVNLRARGRQLAVQFSGADLGSYNRLGAVRYRVAAAGRR